MTSPDHLTIRVIGEPMGLEQLSPQSVCHEDEANKRKLLSQNTFLHAPQPKKWSFSSTDEDSPPTPAPSPVPNIQIDNQRYSWKVHEIHQSPPWDSSQSRPILSHAPESIEDFISRFQTLPNDTKVSIIQKLLSHSGRDVLIPVLNYVEPLLKHDPFEIFPREISLKILSYLDDPFSLAKASQVSRLWYLMLSDDQTWKDLCKRHHFRRLSAVSNVNLSEGLSLSKNRMPSISSESGLFVENDDSANDLTQEWFDPAALRKVKPKSYRSYFKQQYLTHNAWASGGTLASRYTITYPGVATSLVAGPEYAVCSLDNSKIFVFSTVDGRLLRSLFGHIMGVWALSLQGKYLVSGGCDRDVRVWDVSTGQCLQIMRGHMSTVRCIKLNTSGIAVSGSRDSTLRVWDTKSGQCLHTLYGHNSSIRCLDMDDQIVISGSYDQTVRVWRLSDGKLLHTLEGHASQIYSVAYDGKYIASGSLDTTIRIWDPVTGACISVLQGHSSLVGHIQFSSLDAIISGGSDGSLRTWDLNTMQCVHRIAAHDNSVTTLDFDEERIISGGSDGAVRVWDIKTGQHVCDLTSTFDAVWRVAIQGEEAIIVASRNEKVYIEIISFLPNEQSIKVSAESELIESGITETTAKQHGLQNFDGFDMRNSTSHMSSTSSPSLTSMDIDRSPDMDPILGP